VTDDDLLTVIDRHLPHAAAERARASLRARWSKLIATAAEIPLMDADDLAAVLTSAEVAAAHMAADGILTIVEKIETAQSAGLRLVT
jgi:hypothetical protein